MTFDTVIAMMTSVSGFIGHFNHGNVDLTIVGLFVLGGLGGILSGTALSGRTPEQKLSKAFGWFAIIVALFLSMRICYDKEIP